MRVFRRLLEGMDPRVTSCQCQLRPIHQWWALQRQPYVKLGKLYTYSITVVSVRDHKPIGSISAKQRTCRKQNLSVWNVWKRQDGKSCSIATCYGNLWTTSSNKNLDHVLCINYKYYRVKLPFLVISSYSVTAVAEDCREAGKMSSLYRSSYVCIHWKQRLCWGTRIGNRTYQLDRYRNI